MQMSIKFLNNLHFKLNIQSLLYYETKNTMKEAINLYFL